MAAKKSSDGERRRKARRAVTFVDVRLGAPTPPRRQILELAVQLRADAARTGSYADNIVAQLAACAWLYEVRGTGQGPGSKAIESAAAEYLRGALEELSKVGQHDFWVGLTPRPLPAPAEWFAQLCQFAGDMLKRYVAAAKTQQQQDQSRASIARHLPVIAAALAPGPKATTPPEASEKLLRRLETKLLEEMTGDEV